MRFEHTDVFNFENALRGMRNPKESYHLSDSRWEDGKYVIGEKDLDLAQRLIKAGNEHRKFMRQIFVSVDITAPLYWWKEADTYKVGTVANSTSTMHKLATTPITIECIEIDDISEFEKPALEATLDQCEIYRKMYLETKNKAYWKALIRLLPESWLQTRTITMSYENVLSMIRHRKGHKLNEWSGKDDSTKQNFISWAKTLPYADELLFID